GKTCFNTNYWYYVTSLDRAADHADGIASESGESNHAGPSEVTHLFVEPDNKSATYGDALPAATFTIYGDGSRTFTNSPTCSYPSPAPRNATNKPTGEAIANPYTITCTGDNTTTDGKTGVTYGQPYNDGTLHSPGVLKIIQRQITVTATSDTKIYDGTTSSGGTPTITAGSLA